MKRISRSLKQLMKETRKKYEEVEFYCRRNGKRNKEARKYMKIIRKKLSNEKERFQQCKLKLKQNGQELEEEYQKTRLERRRTRRRKRIITSDDDDEEGEPTKKRKGDNDAATSTTTQDLRRQRGIFDDDAETSTTTQHHRRLRKISDEEEM